ncbi:MAG: quinolinate synthase NadA [candidate division Zixibacteria bacterium]|nr:quinolinate synthase NadA [candidate division Zixibacteria bacterium]
MALTFNPIPANYRKMSDDELTERINQKKRELGEKLVILTHHYQRRKIVALGDYKGDSYALSKIAAGLDAEIIAFCGVHFMAEAAEILSSDDQTVYLPNPLAGCPMADMAAIANVMYAWDQLKELVPDSKIIPIAYMNTAADLKAFCGKHDGLVCTSSNAPGAFEWGFERGDKIFFYPDEHLGRNTANKLGIARDQIAVWDFRKRKLGGNSPDKIKNAKVIIWKGYCHVHTTFTPDHVRMMRERFPDVRIVVHPECPEQVVELADANGSTAFIVKYVDEAPSGSTIAIGTEINLVDRMAHEYPDKKVMELSGNTCAMCVNMYRTTLNDLAWCLENLDDIKSIEVRQEIQEDSRKALSRMLDIAK